VSVYLSVAPPDGFTKWGDAEWDRWLRDHPWEAAERICSRPDWTIFLYQLRQNAPSASKRLGPLLEQLVNERPLSSQEAEDFREGLKLARGELGRRGAAEMTRTNHHFASAEDLEAMIASAQARVGPEPTLAEIWEPLFDQVEAVLASAAGEKRGIYFGNV
jgi:hypothetical protein